MFKRKVTAVVLTAVLCAVGVFSAASADTTPGSESDPVVTRSYVDQKISEIMRVADGSGGGISSEEMLTQIEYAVKNQMQKSEGAVFTPVSIDIGRTIFGGEGTEMILRTGTGHIVTSTDTVVNATSGVDLKNGAPVPKGNLLIFPRDDGRGIKAADNCWFLVKGAYTIE